MTGKSPWREYSVSLNHKLAGIDMRTLGHKGEWLLFFKKLAAFSNKVPHHWCTRFAWTPYSWKSS
ncbi:MAG: hypothetical protein C7B43_17975 [Sulfobacillus benefaciens]|uniref:Uncharacterized protein n=1 Tax=Sulfobacillus benefaciens TaxID=453960 RepID=A0A2T2WRQ0_9FIRM|nr:MAG: hypothetical protein C7B43_17975 [Sulfobacillus benefaciens]